MILHNIINRLRWHFCLIPHQKLRNAEEVIRGLEDEKVPLVDASQGQDSPDMVQVDAKIRQAEEEVAELRAALADREKQSQVFNCSQAV